MKIRWINSITCDNNEWAGNSIGYSGGVKIADSLKENTTLTKLDLGRKKDYIYV